MSVVGFIASQSDGWLFCLLLSVDWSDKWSVHGWLAGWFVCYPVCRSVGRTIRPACYPTYHWLTGHPSIYLIANQPTKNRSFTSDQCLHFRYRDWGSTYPDFVRPVGCGGATWAMPASRWSNLGRISSSFSAGYTLLVYPRIDLGRLPKGRLTCFAMPCISIHIYSHIVYSLECSPTPYL